MVSEFYFSLLIICVALERLVELRLARKNYAWSMMRGGREYGAGHYPFMVLIHIGLLAGALAEVWILGRKFYPFLGFSMLFLVLFAQLLRWWVINELRTMWNTRIVVVPGLQRVVSGPFRYCTHPNYLAVAIEGVALPLVHSAWITALVFTMANALLMRIRIREEAKALHLLQC